MPCPGVLRCCVTAALCIFAVCLTPLCGPVTLCAATGSIMGVSNTYGPGRGGDDGPIIGDVICHGKRKYWAHGTSYHYHRGMKAGENTLDALVGDTLASVARHRITCPSVFF